MLLINRVTKIKHRIENGNCVVYQDGSPRWRHQMEPCSALLTLCGEFTGPRWIPHTKASAAELWCFLWSAPEHMIEKTIVRLVICKFISICVVGLICIFRVFTSQQPGNNVNPRTNHAPRDLSRPSGADRPSSELMWTLVYVEYGTCSF